MNYKKEAHKILKQWMSDNGLSGDYVIHHRDDNEDVIAYNKTHYERWGFSEDGSFEHGKYVIFMTRAAHNKHHHIGNATIGERISHSLKGRVGAMTDHKHSKEARMKISLAHIGMKHSKETRDMMARKQYLYKEYTARGGLLKWNSFQPALKNNDPEVFNLISDLLIYKEK